jgi:hypothetical protein
VEEAFKNMPKELEKRFAKLELSDNQRFTRDSRLMHEHEASMGVTWTKKGYRLSGKPKIVIKKE